MSKQYIAYMYRAYPNTEQKALINKTFGCCRKVYNLMLSDSISTYKQINKHQINTPANYKTAFPFLKEVDSLALCNEQLNLKAAFKSFFDKRSGFPKFKSKHHDSCSFTTNMVNNNIVITDKHIRLPKIGSVKIKCHRRAPENYKLKSVTVTRDRAYQFYVSVLYEYETEENPVSIQTHIGLDYMSDGLFADSFRNKAHMPKFYRNSEKKLARLQRQLSKKQKGSKNREKAKIKLAKQAKHVANQRKDFLHKLSTEITNQYDLVSVEDLNLKAISKSLHLGKSTLDNGYGMFLSMLEYKQKQKNHLFIRVNRFFASSQLCQCGYKNSITKGISGLKVKKITCPVCQATYDRDINAAINIDKEGLRIALS